MTDLSQPEPSPHLIPFLNLDEATLRQMIPQGVVRKFPKGQLIIAAGDTSDSLYVILSGRVKVYLSDENGKEFLLSVIVAGDYFGEVALDGGPRTASIATFIPVVQLSESNTRKTSTPESAASSTNFCTTLSG